MQPNILFVLVDSARANLYRLNGGAAEAPALERLAAEGVNCPRTWSTTPICHPARSSLVTGLYPYGHGMITNGAFAGGYPFHVFEDVAFLPAVLREQGYRTGYAGQLHVELPGFDEDRHQATRDYLAWLRDQGYEREAPPAEQAGWLCGTVPYSIEQTRDGQFGQRGLALLDDLCAGSQPWFMQLDFDGPHPPCYVPDEYARRYDPDALPLPPTSNDTLEGRPLWVWMAQERQGWLRRSEAEQRHLNACYHAQATMIDDLVGRVLDRLDQHGQAEHTIVVFTSDHATPVGYHGFAMHGGPVLYEEVLRVPFVVRWPAGLPAGAVCGAAVEHVDLMPTLLEAVGAPPVPSHGESVLGALRGEEPTGPDQSYHVYSGTGNTFLSVRALQRDGWKLIYTPHGEAELYHLREDPHETVNLCGRPEVAEMEQSLRRAMAAEMTRTSDPLRGYARYDLER